MPSLLAIAAHPDDIEFCMAGTMLAMARRGWGLHCFNVCRGNLGSATIPGPELAEVRAREAQAALRKTAKDHEARAAKLAQQVSAIDRAMFDPASADPALAKLTMGDLAQRRGKLASELERVEAAWMSALEAIDEAA